MNVSNDQKESRTSWFVALTTRSKVLEIYLWLIFASLASWPFTRDAVLYAPTVRAAATERGEWILIGVVVLLFPIIFQLIFGVLPFQAIRRRYGTKQYPVELVEIPADSDAGPDRIEDGSYHWVVETQVSSERLLGCLAIRSAAVAKRIYSRSGVYLIVGVFIAFSGLLFFYLNSPVLSDSSDLRETILAYLPRFGILFFIELIAFFFLRQYRAAMDEFRYFEAIQRHREELLALLLVSKEQQRPIDIDGLLVKDAFYSKAQILQKEQTTEIIESRKLEKGELEILEKVVDVMGAKLKA